MPTAARYRKYRKDQTTIWISKNAQDFLSRERLVPGESVGRVLDRMLVELRRLRRNAPKSSGKKR